MAKSQQADLFTDAVVISVERRQERSRAPEPLPSVPVDTPASVEPLSPRVARERAGANTLVSSLAPSAPTPVAPQERTVYSVGDLTRRIKGTLERGFPRVLVRGEVSGFRGPNARGHWYFSLKDSEACIDTKVWASTAARLKFGLRDGLSVVAEGSIDLYEPQGRYSLIVQRLEPEGEGALALAFQQLKEKLQAEGLFGDRRVRLPREVPFLPRRIGVVTSVTGAALRDFLKILHHRHPRLSVLICDARVQGEGAAAEIARAIRRLPKHGVDCVVVTRGGGSVEDLWAFNEEVVARAIHACPVPVVSAVGHEVDFTIADFVADYRAPTPSAAAHKLAPILSDLELSLEMSASRLCRAAERVILHRRHQLQGVAGQLTDPRRQLGHQRLYLSEQVEAMRRSLGHALRRRELRARALSDRLQRQRPSARLQRNRQELSRLDDRLRAAARAALQSERKALGALRLGLERGSPKRRTALELQRLSARLAQLTARMRARVEGDGLKLRRWSGALDSLSPLRVLSRGYTVTFRASDGRLMRSAAELKVGDPIAVLFGPGDCQTLGECEEVRATVTEIKGR